MQVDPKRTLPFAKKQVASVVGEQLSHFKGFFNATQTIFKSLRKEFFSKQLWVEIRLKLADIGTYVLGTAFS